MSQCSNHSSKADKKRNTEAACERVHEESDSSSSSADEASSSDEDESTDSEMQKDECVILSGLVRKLKVHVWSALRIERRPNLGSNLLGISKCVSASRIGTHNKQ